MELFGELVRLYGLPSALMLGGLLILGRVVMVLWRDNQAQWSARLADKDKQIAELQVRITYLEQQRDQALGLAEVGALTSRKLAQRRGG